MKDCSSEDRAALRNGFFDDSGRLFPEETVRKTVQHVSTAVQTDALRKVASSGLSERKRSSQGLDRRSGSGALPKNQKSSEKAPSAGSSSGGKGFGKPFLRAPGRFKGKRKNKQKKGGGA